MTTPGIVSRLVLSLLAGAGQQAVAAALAVALGVAVFILLVLSRCLYVVAPNQLLVVSGQKRRLPDGSVAGYRLVRAGRAIRIPMLEAASTLDLTAFMVEVALNEAFGKEGTKVSVTLVAAVRIHPNEPLVNNAVERFLGLPREKIVEVARQVLECVAREVMARTSADEVQYDRSRFAEKVMDAADRDFSQLGLALDVLKVQSTGAEVMTYRGPLKR